jgi:hypothetical protein
MYISVMTCFMCRGRDNIVPVEAWPPRQPSFYRNFSSSLSLNPTFL